MDHSHWVRLIRLGLIVLTVFALGGVCRNDFIDMDDDIYVTNNAAVQAGLSEKGLRWALTTFHAGYWHPLTWLSLQLDAQIHGPPPKAALGYHLTNLVLHLASVLLLFGVLRKMTGADGLSAVVAALFAVHPMHVESVAWVSERKDVLSTLFWILTMAAYRRYAVSPGVGRYLLVLICYALGLMAKPTLVTLPFVLLLLDYWPLQRSKRTMAAALSTDNRPSAGLSWGWLVAEKLPMLCLLATFSFVTFYAQQRVGAVIPLDKLTLDIRIGNAVLSYVEYLRATVWPAGLAVFYPHTFQAPPWALVGIATAALLAITLLAFRQAGPRPYLLVGWLWFIGTLVPVLGLVQAGEQAWADRFSYVPHIGLFIALVWGSADLLAHYRAPAWAGAGIAGAVLLGCVVVTWRQVGYWRDSTTLWERAFQVTTNNYKAHTNFGLVLYQQGKRADAAKHFSRALEVGPKAPEIYLNLGVALLEHDQLSKAAQAFSDALSMRPTYSDALNNLGVTFLRMRRFDDAQRQFSEAVRLDGNQADTHDNLGKALVGLGRIDDAVTHFNAALSIRPDDTSARLNLGEALMREGQLDGAEQAFAHVVARTPSDARGHAGLGLLALKQGKFDDARRHFQEAIRLDDRSADLHNALGLVLIAQERWADALPELLRAVELLPVLSKYHADLALAFTEVKQNEAAEKAYRESLRLDPDWPAAAAELAWTLATASQAEARNPGEALFLARKAARAVAPARAECYDALAAAFAAQSRFDEAVAAADKAIVLAEGRKLGAYAKKIKERRQLYADKKAYVNTRGEPQTPKP